MSRREARTLAGVASLTTAATTVRTTIRPDLQHATEAALQEGLAQYEMRNGRVQWHGAEANIGEAVRRIEAAAGGAKGKPAWQQALAAAHPPLYDVHWTTAVVLGTGNDRSGGLRVGLADGRVLPLASTAGVRRGINLYDVVFVKSDRAKEQAGRPRRAAGAAGGAGRRDRSRQQDRRDPGDGGRLLLSAEPAQPHHPVAAPAGFLAQALHLSRGAAPRPAAQHAGTRPADYAAADRQFV